MSSVRPRVFGGFLSVGAAVAIVNGCSLLSTDELTGGVASNLDASICTDAGCVSPPLADSCDANVQMDNDNCGACGKRCGAGMSCAGGSCVTGCPGGVMYVSVSNGSDTFDGCTQAKPKHTVSAAVAAALANHTPEIHACAGVYTEPDIELGGAVSLLGGYDCLAWVRTATYGYPTFDGLNVTTLRAAATSTSGVTLSIGGTDLTNAIVIDGLRVEGPSVPPAGISSVAVQVVGGAPTFSNNDVVGAEQSAAPTHGIDVRVAGAPLITKNRVSAGAGAGTSTGIVVKQGGSPQIVGNLIRTPTTVGAVGIALTAAGDLTGPNAIRGNTIQMGEANSSDPTINNIGITVARGSADIIGNVIQGGSRVCPASIAACENDAIFLLDTTKPYPHIIAGNTIVGGTASGGMAQYEFGITVQSSSATIVNNAIQVGTSDAPGTLSSGDIRSLGGATILAEHNTMYATSSHFSIDPTSTLSAVNNLLLGNPPTSTFAVDDNSCARAGAAGATGITDFHGNALVAFGPQIAVVSTGPSTSCANTEYASIPMLQAAEPNVGPNIRLNSSCAPTATDCVVDNACPSGSASPGAPCIQSVLASWDSATQGVADLLDPTRTWKLGSNVLCAIAQGGGDVLSANEGGASASVGSPSVDINGNPRTSPVSIGAYEYDGTCQ